MSKNCRACIFKGIGRCKLLNPHMEYDKDCPFYKTFEDVINDYVYCYERLKERFNFECYNDYIKYVEDRSNNTLDLSEYKQLFRKD